MKGRRAFTLIEVLVAAAIVAVLAALLLPAMRAARTHARIVTAHTELRGIETALQMYADANRSALPPSRFSCNLRAADELPIELARERFLPQTAKLVEDEYTGQPFFIDAIPVRDVFDPNATYKYRAVGAAYLNETILKVPPDPDCARLWVPNGFPDCSGARGRYYNDPRTSPVRFAVWSVGPDPASPKFDYIPGRMPIPSRYWCTRAMDTGVIVHFQSRDGRMFMSP